MARLNSAPIPVSRRGMNTDTLSEFWQMKNGRAISIHEKQGRGFIAFGYLDGVKRRGLRALGSYETLKLAIETCGAFLAMTDGAAFQRFRNCIAAGRFASYAVRCNPRQRRR